MNRPTFRKLPPTTEVSIINQISKELASAFSKDPLARAILGEWPSSTSSRAREFFRLHLLGVGKDMNTESPEWPAFLNNLPSKKQEWYTSFNPQYQEFVDRAYGRGHQLKSLYLLLLGVRPSSQEKGFGTELLRGVQARAAELVSISAGKQPLPQSFTESWASRPFLTQYMGMNRATISIEFHFMGNRTPIWTLWLDGQGEVPPASVIFSGTVLSFNSLSTNHHTSGDLLARRELVAGWPRESPQLPALLLIGAPDPREGRDFEGVQIKLHKYRARRGVRALN
ncbi:hypothetical protein B0H14DRAFT_3171881 [Mycena olivaceomarginata]|nr:hypothetical protein B0H14DRAFT_3171881 [Mycena olivaceomarginata]